MAKFDIDAELSALNFGLNKSFFDDLFSPTPRTKAAPKKTIDEFRIGNGRFYEPTGSSVRRTAFEHVLDRAGIKDFDAIKKHYSNVVKDMESLSGSDVFQPLKAIESHFDSGFMASNISKDEDDKYVIELSAPGRNKDDFQVEVLPDENKFGLRRQVLKISAEKKEHKEDDDGYISEFAKTALAYSHFLPKDSIIEDITAEYINGILVVTVPKKEKTKDAPSKLIAVT